MNASMWSTGLFVFIAAIPLISAVFSNITRRDYENKYEGMEIPVSFGKERIEVEGDEKWHLIVKIRDAECYSARTSSRFTVYLAAIDADDIFLSSFTLESSSQHYRYDTDTNTHIIEHSQTMKAGLGRCFSEGKIDCVPRADAVFIRFHSEPDDPWAIDQIDVDVSFYLLFRYHPKGKIDTHVYNWHFEHAVLLPCNSWLKYTHMYQIGPRNGLFIEHDYLYTPIKGELMRVWT